MTAPIRPRLTPMPRRVAIVGGGASGVLLAVQILRQGHGGVEIDLIERGSLLGCGVAYSTRDPAHLLNTRVSNMSAFPQEPDHFLDWLRREQPRTTDPQAFVSRATYGRYMSGLIDGWAEGGPVRCHRGEAVAVEEGAAGAVVTLGDGTTIRADWVVLATGHALPDAKDDPVLTQPWAEDPPRPDAAVLIVGSGLTMVDQTVSLLEAGHRGPITAVSRRGLLPLTHTTGRAFALTMEDPPVGEGPASLMRWLRARVGEHEKRGGVWQEVVDGLRPHIQALWAAMPLAARRTFLRHAATLWEVHRHRMPPASHRRLEAAIDEGRLILLRGRFESAATGPAGDLVARLRRPDGRILCVFVDRIIDARGIRRDPETYATPLVAHMLKRGSARIDPLRIGLDVTSDGAVIDQEGRSSNRIFTLGPASRAAFWEVTAIPDIRVQAARLAERLILEPVGD